VRLIFETGLRPGEVLALWLEDVNIGELHIDVRDRGELVNLAEIKRPASVRTLDVTQELMNELLAYVSEAHTEAVETNHVFLGRPWPTAWATTSLRGAIRHLSTAGETHGVIDHALRVEAYVVDDSG
jgi:integrase